MRSAGFLVLTAAALGACGMTAVASGPSPADGPGEAGAFVEASTDSPSIDGGTSVGIGDGGVDSATFCETLAADPKVKLCTDFDRAANRTAPYGFDTIDIFTGTVATVGLAPSPLGAAFGSGLSFTLPEGSGSRTARAMRQLVTKVNAPTSVRYIADLDVSLGDLTQDIDIANVDILGVGCAVRPGVRARPSGLEPMKSIVGGVAIPTPASPFHVHLDVTVQPGAITRQAITVNATTLIDEGVFYDLGCDSVGLVVGTYYTGGSGHASAVFDNVVVRTP